MQIYVASLCDYNAGILHGKWIDLDQHQTAEEIQEQINEILKTSPQALRFGDIAEEWAIHDYDEFPDLGEYESLDTIVEVIDAVKQYDHHIVKTFLDWYGAWPGNLADRIDDAYQGEYRSDEEFIDEYIDQIGGVAQLGEKTLEMYFNHEAYTRDVMHEYYSHNGYYFRSV